MKRSKQKIQLLSALLMGLILLLTTAPLQAQDYRPFSWGIKAGINAADMYGDDVGATSAIAGFSGGAYATFRLVDYFAFQPEILFSSKGSDLETGVMRETGPVEYRFGYLEIPVLAKFYIPTNGKIQPNLYSGPGLGFILYGDANDADIDSEMANTDFSLIFGGGLDFKIAKSRYDFLQHIGIDLRYTLGLSDAFDTIGDPDAKNGTLTAAVVFGF